VGERQQRAHALADGRVRVAPQPQQAPARLAGVPDAERRQALGDGAGAAGVPADDVQRLGQAERVPRVAGGREVRVPLPLAAERRGHHVRGELQHPEPAAQ